jgi:hypothetical protein
MYSVPQIIFYQLQCKNVSIYFVCRATRVLYNLFFYVVTEKLERKTVNVWKVDRESSVQIFASPKVALLRNTLTLLRAIFPYKGQSPEIRMI